MPADVAPWLLGCPGTPRQRPVSAARRRFRRSDKTAAPGTFRHRLTPGQHGILEQSSGLLIRGFGVQVPGGAPVLTWGFTAPGHFLRARFVPVVAPWLLARTDPAIGSCQKRPARRPMRGHSPRNRAVSYGRRPPGSLDQWSRPSARAPGAHPESPMPMTSRSVRPAGKRHSHGGYAGGADAPDRPVACKGRAGQRQCASGRRCRLPRRSKRLIRWALPSAHASGRGYGGPAGDGSVRRMLTYPASGGEDGRSRAGCPDPAGDSGAGNGRARTGLCAPGMAHGRAPLAVGCRGRCWRGAFVALIQPERHLTTYGRSTVLPASS